MSRKLLLPFAWFDAFVQKRFDSLCFFLMRRFGVRKSSIRYVLYGVVICAYAGDLFIKASYGLLSPFSAFIGAFFILILLLSQAGEARLDREAEAKPGMASKADRSSGSLAKVACYLFGAFEALHFKWPPSEYVDAGLTHGEHLFPTVCSMAFWIAYLAYLYLRKTPMNPPPEKVTETVGTPQPAPVGS
jgi:hypothetical protein